MAAFVDDKPLGDGLQESAASVAEVKCAWQRPLAFVQGAVVIPGDALLSPAKDYHWPWMLNGRVRNGNGWDHPGMLTEKAPRVSIKAAVEVALCHEPKKDREQDQCGEAFGC
jgi:hypothetical protein